MSRTRSRWKAYYKLAQLLHVLFIFHHIIIKQWEQHFVCNCIKVKELNFHSSYDNWGSNTQGLSWSITLIVLTHQTIEQIILVLRVNDIFQAISHLIPGSFSLFTQRKTQAVFKDRKEVASYCLRSGTVSEKRLPLTFGKLPKIRNSVKPGEGWCRPPYCPD